MAVSPNVLIGPRLKVERANRHIDEIFSVTTPLCKDWYTFRVEADVLPPNAKPSSFTLRYRPTQPIPEKIGLIIGDAVHNLRSALDHLATGIRTGMVWKSDGHFPMRKRREDLIAPSGDPIEDLAAIEAALPGSIHLLLDNIRPKNGSNEALWSFHDLNNSDKHRLILPTITVAEATGLDIPAFGLRNCGVGSDAAKPFDGITANTPFAIQNDFNLSVDVKFGKGTVFENKPVIPTLTQICGLVGYTIDEFERLIRQQ